jgi:hypothetical protein
MRKIKFRVWSPTYREFWYFELGQEFEWKKNEHPDQYTGLKDKNDLTEIYEGDIIDIDGTVRGNIYETPIRQATDLVIEGLGTKAWRDTEQKAMERGCRYPE